jgi:hypothetical protein
VEFHELNKERLQQGKCVLVTKEEALELLESFELYNEDRIFLIHRNKIEWEVEIKKSKGDDKNG